MYSTYCQEQESDQKKSVKCYVLDDTVYNEYSSTWGAAEDDLSISSTGWPAASSLHIHDNKVLHRMYFHAFTHCVTSFISERA